MRGDVVQLSPTACREKKFAGCFMIVTKPSRIGAEGYIQHIGPRDGIMGGITFYRAGWDEFLTLGPAPWVARRISVSDDEDDEDNADGNDVVEQ